MRGNKWRAVRGTFKNRIEGAGHQHGQAQVHRLCEKEDGRWRTHQPGQWAHSRARTAPPQRR